MNISKTTWPADTKKLITVIAGDNVHVRILYKKRGTVNQFAPLAGDIRFMGDEIWELETSLPVGEYLIKILTDDTDNIHMIEVVPKELYDQNLVLQLLKDDIDNLTARIISKLSFKVSG